MPARFRAVKTRPLAFLRFPSRTCPTRRRKAGPSGQPALSGGGAGPEGRRPGRRQAAGLAPPRARATSRGCSWEFTPLPPASPGGGGPRGYRGGVGSARGPAAEAADADWNGAPPPRCPEQRLRELAAAAAFWGRPDESSRGFVWEESTPWCDAKFTDVSDFSTFQGKRL